MPVLEVDGKQLGQSYAIDRFLARKYGIVEKNLHMFRWLIHLYFLGLAGKDDFEAAQLDALADLKSDFQNEIRPFIRVALGQVDGDKEKLFNEVVKPAFEKIAPILVKTLKESGTGFFGKGGVSWVDFEYSEMIYSFQDTLKELLNKYPELSKHMEKVHALPQLKQYLETRPKTPL